MKHPNQRPSPRRGWISWGRFCAVFEVLVRIVMRLFAFQAEAAGREVGLELPDRATAGDAVALLRRRFPAMPWAEGTAIAVNMEVVAPGQALAPGDVVAIIPPVSGG